MPVLNAAAVVSLELEKVRKALPVLYGREDKTITLIEKRTDMEVVSARAMRIPIQIRPGGAASQTSFDGAALGRGSGTEFDKFTVTPLDFKFASEMTLAAEYETDSNEKAIANAVKRETVNASKQFRAFTNKLLMTAGNGVLSTITSGAGTTSLTLGGNFGAQLLMPGQPITSYNAAQSTQRTASPVVTRVNLNTNVVTTDVAFTNSPATNDVVCVGGLAGATPVSLFGIPYFLNTTGFVLGLDRSLNPELITPTIAANSQLTPSLPRQAIVKAKRMRGLDSLKKGIWLSNPIQMAAWEEASMNVMTINGPGGGKSIPDLLFDGEGKKTIAGRPVSEDVDADPTRLDFLNLEDWGRAITRDVDLIKIGSQTVFPIYSTSDGAPTAAFVWYQGFRGQIFCQDPGSGLSITNLLKPAGY